MNLSEGVFNIALFLSLLLLILIFIPCGLIVYLLESVMGDFKD